METTTQYSTEERIMAAVSHAAILLPYVGAIVPLGVWVTQREKSDWVRFQALQALVFQTMLFVVLMLSSCLVIPILFASMGFAVENPDVMFSTMMGSMFLPYGVLGLMILLELVAGVLCMLGKDVRIPFLGKRISKYLEEQDTAAVEGGEND
ncbi:MAG: DUF4870 domain-containing protein [Chloroflexota bacterium]